MAARKRKPDPALEAVREVGARVAAANLALVQLPCPSCGQRTLIFEYVVRSGIYITCDGYDEKEEDSECQFTLVVLVNDEKPAEEPVKVRGLRALPKEPPPVETPSEAGDA